MVLVVDSEAYRVVFHFLRRNWPVLHFHIVFSIIIFSLKPIYIFLVPCDKQSFTTVTNNVYFHPLQTLANFLMCRARWRVCYNCRAMSELVLCLLEAKCLIALESFVMAENLQRLLTEYILYIVHKLQIYGCSMSIFWHNAPSVPLVVSSRQELVCKQNTVFVTLAADFLINKIKPG